MKKAAVGAPLFINGRRCLLFVLAGLNLAGASADAAAGERRTLRVATSVFEPFVIREKDRYEGFSIELWESIARAVGADYEYVETRTVTDLLDRVRKGECDLAFSGISMTPKRERELDFSYPYFDAGLQIMVRSKSESSLGNVFKTAFSVILSRELLMVVAALSLILLGSSHLIWWFERRQNPGQFLPGYLRGLSGKGSGGPR